MPNEDSPMSVTFFAVEAVTIPSYIPCDSPDCSAESRCGYCRDGQVLDYVDQSANFSNRNAGAVLEILGLPNTPDGEIAADVVPMVRKTLFGALNVVRLRQPGVFPTVVQGNMFSTGSGDEDVLRRLMQVDAVLAWAEENNSAVSWG